MNGTVILVTKPFLGTVAPADTQFGEQMMDKFFHTLEAHPQKPLAICFYTEGVKLTARGSALELSLKVLAEQGVRLAICETCLKHYGLEQEVAVGEVGGMSGIVQLMTEARNVITI